MQEMTTGPGSNLRINQGVRLGLDPTRPAPSPIFRLGINIGARSIADINGPENVLGPHFSISQGPWTVDKLN